MHISAYKSCLDFYSTYSKYLPEDYSVVEVGSQNVNGSLREIFKNHNYTGLDFATGRGVDIVILDPYKFPLPNETADVVICSSCLEHSEMFWLTYLEMLRILKPHGLLYINAPSNGAYHLYPVDCWRFFPDAGDALISWAKYNGLNPILLESYMTPPDNDIWKDFVAIFCKNNAYKEQYVSRVLDTKTNFFNGKTNKSNLILNQKDYISQ